MHCWGGGIVPGTAVRNGTWPIGHRLATGNCCAIILGIIIGTSCRDVAIDFNKYTAIRSVGVSLYR